MPEIQSIQPSAIPSWVMMDQHFRYKDPGSFRADAETSAETQDTNGDPVRVSFDLQSPPGSSRLCLHCPEEREPSGWDIVVAAHRDAVLFRIEVDFDGLPVNRSHAVDYFIYRASSSSAPKLTLLPRCYSTSAEISEAVAEDAASWRGKWRLVNNNAIGLLAAEEGFLVAELLIETWSADDKTAPLEAELFRLFSSSSPASANGGGQWELTLATSRDSKVTFQDVVGWETHRVVPFAGYLCWADYSRGVLFCDVLHKAPALRYLRLPVDGMPPEDFPKFSRTVCVTNNGETMKFVKVVNNSSNMCPACKHRSGFTISVWTLMVVNDSDMEWVEDVMITDNELWAMAGYDHDHLPRSVPQFPLVSMDDPNILYFVVSGRPAPSPCIVTLDMKSRTVLRYDGIEVLPFDSNIISGFGFFPSSLSNYLTKHSSS
ncbi:unnamed protein product [Alopecurus aequalis]